MKNLTHWILALVALAGVASFSGAWTSTQEPPRQEKKMEKAPAKKLAQKNRSEKHAALRKVLPTLKTSLVEAITLAEKETGGKAYSAGVEIMQGKPSLQVNLFVGEKFTVVNVDHETKKVTLVKKGAENEGEETPVEEEGEDEGEEGDGG